MSASSSDATAGRSAAALMAEAADREGHADWGDRGFVVSLTRLLDSCAATGRLSPAGWQVLHRMVHRHLRNRLRLRAHLGRRPAAAETPLGEPLVITGLPRTGTTLLHNLLAQDRRHRVLRLWEALSPVPAEGDGGDEPARVDQARRWLEGLAAHAPGFTTVHPLTAEGPEECDQLLRNAFASQHLSDMFDAEAYARWFFEGGLHGAYAEYATWLRVLTRDDEEPPRRWVLKWPGHLPHLDALRSAVPGAVVVHCHRDPVEAVPSYASLIHTVRDPNTEGGAARLVAGRQALQRCQTAVQRAQRARADQPPDSVIDLAYSRLVAEPLATVAGLYADLGARLPDDAAEAMRRWLEHNPRDRHGVHRYDPAGFGLPPARVRAALADYYERYGHVVA